MAAADSAAATLAELEEAIEVDIDDEPLTEGGNASRLVAIHGHDMRYCHTYNAWYIWNGQYWKRDEDGAAKRFAEDVVRYLYQKAQNAASQSERKVMAEAAFFADSSRGINNMLEIAKHREGIAVTWEVLDSDPWLLGAGDVTIDLRTCKARPARREDMITKQIGTTYDPAAQCPRWDQFMIEIFPDQTLRTYVQRAFGYSLTGSNAEEVFFLCHGTGQNGKSKALAILKDILGDYAKHADFTTFCVQRNEKIRSDLAALFGARVVTAIEAKDGSKFDMEVIKAWSGRDDITARFLYSKEFTFKPEGKLWFAANNKPIITGRHLADWRRVQLIPFVVTIAPEKRDKHLDEKLRAELPGILNWALEGLKDYLVVGLNAPKAVTEANDKYQQENDSLQAFISACCDEGKDVKCLNKDLWVAYEGFCSECGYEALKKGQLREALIGMNHTQTKGNQGMVWHGIALKPPEPEPKK